MSRGTVHRKRPLWVSFGAIVVGVLLFFLAASGGFNLGGLSLQFETRGSQLFLSALGVVLAAAGVLMLADDRGSDEVLDQQPASLADYQIKMLRPNRFQRKMIINGGCLNQPPKGALRLFTVLEDGRFRPQSIVSFDDRGRQWSGPVDLGPGSYYSVYVVAALVDEAGMALWDYFFQVGSQTDWEPVVGRIRKYAVECDRFLVEGVISE